MVFRVDSNSLRPEDAPGRITGLSYDSPKVTFAIEQLNSEIHRVHNYDHLISYEHFSWQVEFALAVPAFAEALNYRPIFVQDVHAIPERVGDVDPPRFLVD